MEKVTDNVFKINTGSNVYFLEKEKILIDTGIEDFSENLKQEIDCNSIQKVIFTHLHFDHIGNFKLFKNAKFYASKKEINFFKKSPLGAILDRNLAKWFNVVLNDVNELKEFKVIETPGHTIGSICLLYKDVLFSGDTLFDCGCGRTDLPSSVESEMKNSLKKLDKIKYKFLCPGHDY
jgi:glyoxylase-like metal-dependent hydrolase (beta-lactamase superfamily II)